MNPTTPTLDAVLKQARQLSPTARLQLAEQLLHPAKGDIRTAVVPVRRFGADTQKRLQGLMDRSNEGALTAKERDELKTLVARHEKLMLLNSEALLKATRPELFNSSGRLIQKHLNRALRQKAQARRNLQAK